MASAETKQATSRLPRNSLNAALILDAAQELIASGRDLSIRVVASHLACTPMALYRYFPDKNELLLALLDRVIGSIPLNEEIENWQDRLLSICADHLHTLQRNPWAISLLFQHPDPGPKVRKLGDVILALLKQGGQSNEGAVSTFSSILALNYGWAGFTGIQPGSPTSKTLLKRLGQRPSSRDSLRETSALWSEFQNLGSDAHHKIAILKLLEKEKDSWLGII